MKLRSGLSERSVAHISRPAYSESSVGGNMSSYGPRRYKKRNYKRRPYRRNNAYSLAKKAYSGVRALQKKEETKKHQVTLSSITDVLASGHMLAMHLIAQGDLGGARDGNKISPYALLLTFQWLGDALQTNDIFRTIVFRDKQQKDSADPVPLDVLEETSSLSLYNIDNHQRFKILYDECFTGSNDTNIQLSFVRKLRIKLSLPIIYGGAAATNIIKNGLYLFVISNATGNYPKFEYTWRLLYNDS